MKKAKLSTAQLILILLTVSIILGIIMTQKIYNFGEKKIDDTKEKAENPKEIIQNLEETPNNIYKTTKIKVEV